MTIPDKVKVGGMTYDVRIVDDLDATTGAKIEANKQLIRVGKATDAYMKQAFLHELFHAVNMEVSEVEIEFFASALYQIIVDNPQIFEGGDRQNGHK